MWGRSQTVVSYQGYLCCICHNHSRRETFSRLCVLLSAAPRHEIYLYEMFWCPRRSRCGHNRVNLSHCYPDWSECCYFHPAHVSSCGQSKHNPTPVSGSGLTVWAPVSRAGVVMFPDSNITPLSCSPTSGHKLNIGRRLETGDTESGAQTWAVVTWPIWLRPEAGLPLVPMVQCYIVMIAPLTSNDLRFRCSLNITYI